MRDFIVSDSRSNALKNLRQSLTAWNFRKLLKLLRQTPRKCSLTMSPVKQSFCAFGSSTEDAFPMFQKCLQSQSQCVHCQRSKFHESAQKLIISSRRRGFRSGAQRQSPSLSVNENRVGGFQIQKTR